MLADLRPQTVLALGSSDEQTSGHRNNQRGNLGNEAVTDGKEGVFFKSRIQREALLQHANAETADDIDQRDENARDSIASHEFAGTIHRTVEVGFFLHLETAARRGEFVNDAGIEFRIDGHLFARHGVQGETRGHLGDTACALRDNHEIDNHQNDENHRADEVVSLNEHLAEGFNDAAGVAIQENQARGGDIQGQPQKRYRQQDRGKC